jgi:hypothetical protein
MTTEAPTRSDLQLMLREARRYLRAVDAFRAEGCEPCWRPDREPLPRKKRNARLIPVP